MPTPSGGNAATIAAIAAPAAGSLINSVGGAFGNRANRRFSERMYDRTKADNLEFWQMQNEYNSPQAQMQRFRDAGLNPNLIYGQGNSGNASPVSTPDVQPLNRRDPQYGNALITGGLGAINAMYDLQIKGAQVDNLKAQNQVILEDALLKKINRLQGEFNLNLDTDSRDISLQSRAERLRQLKTGIDLSLNEDARRAISNASSVQQAAEQILNLREQRKSFPLERSRTAADTARIHENIRLMQKDGTLKQLDIELKQLGIQPGDPMWTRMLGQLFSSPSGSTWKDDIWNSLFKRN